MARLAQNGFETQLLSTSGTTDPEGYGWAIVGSGPPSIATSFMRSGEASLFCPTGAANYVTWSTFSLTTNTNAYVRAAIRWNTDPAAAVIVLRVLDSGAAAIASVRLNADLTMDLINSHGTPATIASSGTLASNTWYVVEMRCMVPTTGANGTLGWRIDGVGLGTTFTTDLGNNAISEVRAGRVTNAGPAIYVDDLAVNDDTGAASNDYCDLGKIVLLKPTADNTRDAGWVAGAGGTTNLWSALDNRPPTGVALASGTNTSQIKNASSSGTNDVYAATLGAYTDPIASGGGGMSATDTLLRVFGIVRAGNNSATVRTMKQGGGVTANPAFAETDVLTAGATAGTEGTGWATNTTAAASGSGITTTTAPVLRVRRATATTDTMMVDFLGIMVEYNEVNSLVVPSRTARNPLLRR